MMIPKINHLFFTIYFLLFASFPFIHCHLNESPCSTDNTPCGISFIKHASSDNSCCEFHSEKHDSHEHHTHFLVEDARTNNRSNDVNISKLPHKYEIIKNHADLKPLFAKFSLDYFAKSVDDFRNLYSGLSPPII